MIRCESCGAVHPPNTLYCDECGFRLADARNLEVGPPDGKSVADPLPPIRLTLRTPNNGPQFEVLLATELFVGRSDLTAPLRPDVDLSPLDAMSRGVSRRHARLLRSGPKVLVEDLRSTNGTFLRGTRLVAHRPADVRSGDEIQFGRVVLKVVFDG